MSNALFWIAAVPLAMVVAPKIIDPLLILLASAPLRLFAAVTRVWRVVGELFSRNGKMDASHAVTFHGMSAVMLCMTAFLGIIGYNLLAPSLGPILGLPGDDLTVVPALARGAIVAILLPAFIAGVCFADLAGWVKTTPIAYASNGLRTALFIVVVTLLLCVAAAIAAGAYRGGVMMEPVVGPDATTRFTSYMAAFIVVVIDVLVMAGIFLGAISLEGVFLLVALIVCVVAAAVLTIVACLLSVLHAVLGPIGNFVSNVMNGLTRVTHASAQGGNQLLLRFVHHDAEHAPGTSVPTSTVAGS